MKLFRIFKNPKAIPIPDVIFHYIKPVSLIGRIRVFSNYGNLLCDVYEGKEAVEPKRMSVAQFCEVIYIMDNYSRIYKQLEK